MMISIIVPVYNEEKTIKEVLEELNKLQFLGLKKEIIVVNDGSTDSTRERIDTNKAILINLNKNRGKGYAIREGIKHAKGNYITIQDADLEAKPSNLELLVEEVIKGNCDVVYTTRLNRLPNKKYEKNLRMLSHFIGNRTLSLFTSILFFVWLTDIETCHKIFPKKIFTENPLKSNGFEIEAEITAKILKSGYRIKEINVVSYPRSTSEGKKFKTFKDGSLAFINIIKYRFRD